MKFATILSALAIIPFLVSSAPVPSKNDVIASDSTDLMKRSPQEPVPSPVTVDLKIDVNDFVNQITHAIQSAKNRDGFVRQAMEVAFESGKRRRNVMVFNLSQGYSEHFHGVEAFQSFVYDGIPFGVWIFQSGTFENQGDGGWLNWAFKGSFTRTGNQGHFVTFDKFDVEP